METRPLIRDATKVVLDAAIRHWKEHFTGLDSIHASGRTGLPHQSVLKAYDELEEHKLATVNRGVRGVALDLARPAGAPIQPVEVSYSIIFPCKRALAEALQREGSDYGPFLNRLHLGESQVATCFFKADVLQKYYDQQEKYDFDDSDMDGCLGTKASYLASLREESRASETIPSVTYGKRKLAQGGVSVVAILKDLARLPHKEQQHWAAHELEQPLFADEDSAFELFVSQEFGGEFVDHQDAIRMVYQAVEGINGAVGETLLHGVAPNPHLGYPLYNNRKAYSRAHNELRKVVGADAINVKAVRRVIHRLEKATAPEETASVFAKVRALFTRAGGGSDQDKPWAIFKRLVRIVCGRDSKRVLEPLERVSKKRSLHAHEVDELALETDDFTELFKQDCLDVVKALDTFKVALASSFKETDTCLEQPE